MRAGTEVPSTTVSAVRGGERVPSDSIGPYRLLADLGSGGMGTVHLAELARAHAGMEPGTRVALKVILPRLLEDPGVVRRFEREAGIGIAVRHPNVVRTLDVGSAEADGRPVHFLAMEYVRGQTLRSLLRSEGALPEELCRRIGTDVARGLEAIHAAGAIHRDLKPENILITEEQDVRVMDLGVAKIKDEATRLTRTGAFVGSLNYASPEQIREGGASLDARADLFALGVVLYEAAAGRHPFGGGDWGMVLRRILMESPGRLAAAAPSVSSFLEEVVHRLLAKDREERFASARDVLAVLEGGENSTWWRCRTPVFRRGERRALRRIRLPRETEFFGREEELGRLGALWDEVREGRGRAVLVEGEAGVGKTRFVDEFVGRLASAGEDVQFLFGSYPPIGAAAAAGAISTAFRDHLGPEGLEEALREILGESPETAAALAAVLRGDAAARGGEALPRTALAAHLVRVTRALSEERPTVILADDLHFAPEQGRALFAALALAAADLRVLVVGTSRPGLPREWSAGFERLGNGSRLVLPRLGPRDLARLLVSAVGSEGLARELEPTVARKSDGNPFFVFEILRGLREGKVLHREEDGTWVRTRVLDEGEIPSTILDLIQARMAVLDEVDRDLLDVAACCGFEFDPLLVGDVLGMPTIPLLKRLGHLEREHRLVRSVGVRCVFDHHQVQEALYAGLSELLRREYHGALAAALERREGAEERDPEDLEGATAWALADHFLRADRGDRALRYVDRALDYLEGNYLNEAAVDLAGRVHRVPGLLRGDGRLRVLIRKAERLELLGRWEEERRTLDEALRDADGAGDAAARARVRRRLGRHLCRLARYAEALEHLTRSLELARESGDPGEEAATLGNLGVVCWHLGRYEEARDYQERTLAAAVDGGGFDADFTATGSLPDLWTDLGRAEEALEHTTRQYDVAREIGDRRTEAAAVGNLGGLRYDRGEYEEARGCFEKALGLARAIGDRRGEARAAGNLGRVLRDLGRTGDALGRLEASLAIAREIGYLRGETRALIHLSRVDRDLGRPESARGRLHRSLDLARQMGAPREEAQALRDLAILSAAEGDAVGAEEGFHASLAAWGGNHLGGKASTHLALGRLLAAEGRPSESLPHLAAAAALARRTGAADESALAAAFRATLPGGDAARAARIFESLSPRLRVPERMEAAFLLWRAGAGATFLDQAARLGAALLEGAPRAHREGLEHRVPLLRDLDEAVRTTRVETS